MDKTLKLAESLIPDAIETITRFVGFGAVSGDPDRANRVVDLAHAVADHLRELPGSPEVRVHDLQDGKQHREGPPFPCVTAEWRQGDDLPTVLIYGHGDVQPAKESEWHSPPFKAEVRKDEQGESRLYGRGTADDIGGWYSHVVAIKAWLGIRHELPVNVRLFIEFEEEIGSRNLMAYVGRLGSFFDVDAMVLTDCENPSVTTPGFTTSLRGLATANLCCETTDDGPMDASVALCFAVSRLLDDDGRPIFARVEDIPEADRRDLAEVDLPGDLPVRGRSNAEWAWRQPALTIAALSFGDAKAQIGNNIRASVRMRLSLPADMKDGVKEVLGQPSSILGVRYSILPVEQSILEVTRTELDVVCETGRQAAGHSGLYGSIWADPSCFLMKRISRLGALGERIREISITQADLPALDIASAGPRTACARLSVRVAPGGTADAVLQEVDENIRATSRPEVAEELQRIDAGHGGSWSYNPPNCMGLRAADRAYEAVWGKRPVRVGIGGSIPFVASLGQRFGATTPMILNGVLDPASALHAPNESLHLEVFRKAVLTNVYLLAEFGRIPKGKFLKKY